jgi:hypothetical protein
MNMDAELRRMVNKILQAKHGEDPSIDMLLLACPELSEGDWVNYRSADECGSIGSLLTTDQLEWLIKAMVLSERHFEWKGGSVAAAIWLFQVYRGRSDGDWRQLADWILGIEGRNSFLPFGSYIPASITTLEQLGEESQKKEERREARKRVAVKARFNRYLNMSLSYF